MWSEGLKASDDMGAYARVCMGVCVRAEIILNWVFKKVGSV